MGLDARARGDTARWQRAVYSLDLAGRGASRIEQLRKQRSASIEVAQAFLAAYRDKHPDAHIDTLDVEYGTLVPLHFMRMPADTRVISIAAYEAAFEQYDYSQEIIQRSVVLGTKHAARIMQTQKSGSIVNVASINGVIPGPLQGVYSITKAAVISMTKAFARECAPQGIRVNALLPGLTDTKFAAALTRNPVVLDKVLPHVPMGRVAQPDEMAGAVLYLVSPAASYTTGVALNVDGGYLIA
mgnify:CR=1 FL=1